MSYAETGPETAKQTQNGSVTSKPNADIKHRANFILASTGLLISTSFACLLTAFLAIAFAQEREQGDRISGVADNTTEVSPPVFDLANLPSLDTIGPQTNIAVFLQRNVPSEMRVAALRRAWLMDPAIRDFKGLQEIDWNFDTISSIPGFGDLGPKVNIERMVAQIIGETPRAFACSGKSADAYKRTILASIFLPHAKGLACD